MGTSNYSNSATGMHQENQELFPILSPRRAGRDDKKVNLGRVKSPYRDARFRQRFQGVERSGDAGTGARTSVTDVVRSSPPTPTPAQQPRNATTNTPAPAADTPAATETLTDKEQARTKRFWSHYGADTPFLPQHTTPAPWRDLSDVARLEQFHYAVASFGPATAFTLNLSPEVEAQVRKEPKAAKWISARIARRLSEALGRKVDFWFAFEITEGHRQRLHLHGEIAGLEDNDYPAVRKALRLAGGEWKQVRQHQAHLEPASVVWANYAAKHSFNVRPHKGRFSTLPRPISGDWYFATNGLRSTAKEIYTTRRAEVLEL